jgi:hypothetical protein
MTNGPSFVAVPITLADANDFVEVIHRHNGPLPSAKFAIAAIGSDTGMVHGVAIAGRPKARLLDDGYTLEINRVCTDGTYNCCSFLYARCIRTAKALGYSQCITYTLTSEPGTSLKAAGWREQVQSAGGSWLRPNQIDRNSGTDSHDLTAKSRWTIRLNDSPPPLRMPREVASTKHATLFEDIV